MAPPPSSHPKTPLKILMLHGYTQSGPLFHAKARALEKHIQKSFPLHDISFHHPTGPLPLDPADIPGYVPSSESTPQEPEAFAWWRRSNYADPPEYTGLDTGLSTIAQILTEQGPFDGVIGFSQGAACAAMIASLLEPNRRDAFTHFSNPANNAVQQSSPPSPATVVTGIPFPAPFENITTKHKPFKFAVCYSGFRAPGARYRGFYERPEIQTPVLHVLGSLDAIVDEGRSRALIEACEGIPEEDGKVIWHPGGHFLPSQRPYLDGVLRFIKGCLEGGGVDGKKGGKEEGVEDMELPF